ERELSVELAVHDLACGGADPLGALRVEQAELLVRLRARTLDEPERPDEPTAEADAGDREVVDRPLGLGAVVDALRYLDLAQRVLLDPIRRHPLPPRAP